MKKLLLVLLLTGCVQNRYKITTQYANHADETIITSEVEGKATIGKVASIYERVLEFVNKAYIGKK
jgi:competence transcription factor ComK